jgi:hypothetical protein
METNSSVSERVLPGELGEEASLAEFEQSCLETVQEYALLLNELGDLSPYQRHDEARITCEIDQIIGRIRSHIKWATKKNIDTTELERLLQ